MDQGAALLHFASLNAVGLWTRPSVVWGGEFGRTPVSGKSGTGRDTIHGKRCGSPVGGFRRRIRLWRTDEFGFKARKVGSPLHDLHAKCSMRLAWDNTKVPTATPAATSGNRGVRRGK